MTAEEIVNKIDPDIADCPVPGCIGSIIRGKYNNYTFCSECGRYLSVNTDPLKAVLILRKLKFDEC